MAIYRFRVSFEDYDDVERDIDIKSNQTFEDLHRAIHGSTGYKVEVSSSFYVSNDQWIKNEEIAFLPNQRKINNEVALMENSKLSSFIDDPHQKFYYIYNFERPFDFHVELIKIMLNEESGKSYPQISRTLGEAPKIAGSGIISAAEAVVSDDFDFLNEEDFQPEDPEDLEQMTDIGINTDQQLVNVDDEEKDEFMDEFSDNEGYDPDDLQKDDY
ncbi:IS1096 element passenger TnpR family protein [Daejeonella sp.]|uniref:IS1096 element passenger TnpR family protein n=1 Tax=Daejeonella sp. TaxID=2805397 RepID=UPI003982FDDA